MIFKTLTYDHPISIRFSSAELSPIPFDYALSWQLALILQSSSPSPQLSHPALFSYLTHAFAHQLLIDGHWEWTCFLWQFHRESQTREWLVRDLITRMVGAKMNMKEQIMTADLNPSAIQSLMDSVMNDQQVMMLCDDFGIQRAVIYSALADYAASTKNILLEIACQQAAEDYNRTFQTILQNTLPIAIIQHDIDAVEKYLNLFEGHEDKIPLWGKFGDALEAYVHLVNADGVDENMLDMGMQLLEVINGWKKEKSIIKEDDLGLMLKEMNWRILAFLIEIVKICNVKDDPTIESISLQLSKLDMPYEMRTQLQRSFMENDIYCIVCSEHPFIVVLVHSTGVSSFFGRFKSFGNSRSDVLSTHFT